MHREGAVSEVCTISVADTRAEAEQGHLCGGKLEVYPVGCTGKMEANCVDRKAVVDWQGPEVGNFEELRGGETMFSEAMLVGIDEVALMQMFSDGITDNRLHDETSN